MPEVLADEAVRLLGRLHETGARIRVTGVGSGWSIGIAGKIGEVDPEAVRVVSTEGDEVLAVRLDMDGLTFWSGDPEDLPADLRRGIAFPILRGRFVGIVLPFRAPPGMLTGPVCDQQSLPRERIFLCEVKDSR